jgi:hypothetical protein
LTICCVCVNCNPKALMTKPDERWRHWSQECCGRMLHRTRIWLMWAKTACIELVIAALILCSTSSCRY